MPLPFKIWKKVSLNSDCVFYINTRRILANGKTVWHVSNLNITHNHHLDSFVYLHKSLQMTEERIFCKMLDFGIESSMIESSKISEFVQSEYNLNLSTEQKTIKQLEHNKE